ncbi:MAG: hypothetical protein K5978_06785 [Campylobacter sp.]|nr:hypothetical protein [Campylobacter sp.]
MKYILLKEFLKFKFVFLFFALGLSFCVLWCYFEISGGMKRFGVGFYTLEVIYNKNFTYNFLDILNIALAFAIGFCSMFAERLMGRIRVQFHFPHSYLKNALYITLIPLLFLLLLYVLEIFAMVFMLYQFFQPELVNALISTLVYSCIFGVGVFYLSQAMLIEPDIKKVFAYVLVLLMSGFLYFKINPDVDESGLYYLNDNFCLYLGVFLFFAIASVMLSLQNYKKGYIK